MFEYSSELEIHNHIKENFNRFFDFNLMFDEFEVANGRIDFVGEDTNNYYVVELKKEIVTIKAITQIDSYINKFKETKLYNENPKQIIGILTALQIENKTEKYLSENLKFIKLKNIKFIPNENYKITKCYCLSEKALNKIDEVQKEHNFFSASLALDYILSSQSNETKIKKLVYDTMSKIMCENNVSFNSNNKNDMKAKVDNEVENVLKNATDDIFNNMPD